MAERRLSKVIDYIKPMMPSGSNATGNWNEFPEWPPDLFAVAATIVQRWSCHIDLIDLRNLGSLLNRKKPKHARVVQIGDEWRKESWWDSNNARAKNARIELQELWRVLCEGEVESGSSQNVRDQWRDAALKLMIASDVASRRIGFFSDSQLALGKRGKKGPITFESWVPLMYYEAPRVNKYRPSGSAFEAANAYVTYNSLPSVCRNVPADLACVQPKTRTPRVGCAIEALSHHLALLPGVGEVRTAWNNDGLNEYQSAHVFNILIVPFPYSINGNSFRPIEKKRSDEPRLGNKIGVDFFDIKQDWLKTTSTNEFCQFIEDLIKKAKEEFGSVNGIVLPEMALDVEFYNALVEHLVKLGDAGIEFLISGVKVSGVKNKDVGGDIGTNVAATTVFGSKKKDAGPPEEKDAGPREETVYCALSTALQIKHHRWKLNKTQIVQYSLGDALNPRHEWWESTSVGREMMFYVFRKGACFTTLVCEDLARAHPGQTVIRAIGPNLIFALLMDGPQLQERWPGRYAMGLADDPGSSVLSVTSLGLVTRSNLHFNRDQRSIGLWRDCQGNSRALSIPFGNQGLLLNLTERSGTETTLDGRSDDGNAYEWELSGVLPIKMQDAPSWAVK